VVALLAAGIGFVFFKRVTGMRLTRQTVSDDIGMLKKMPSSPDGAAPVDDATAPSVGGAGKDQPGVTVGSGGDGVPAPISARSLGR
jgi:hypothetical protein